MEKKVAELEHEILMNVELKSKLKQENTQLVHRYSQKYINRSFSMNYK